MTPKDQTYFKRRAIEEDHAAIKATSMPVRERHEDMARLYATALIRVRPLRRASDYWPCACSTPRLISDFERDRVIS